VKAGISVEGGITRKLDDEDRDDETNDIGMETR
jgi:hypothetical protein